MTSLWVEEYRPKTVDDYVFQSEEQKATVKRWITEGKIPHLLFSGRPGTGKTTLAKILINQLEVQDIDVMYANGSKEGRKIEWVDKLIGFCQTIPFGDFKVVLIDEADYMNAHSVQPALRNLMEECSETVRFILTCNYPNRIIPAIHSRCQGFHIEKLDQVAVTERVATILIEKGVNFELDVLDTYVKATYPDMRKCINLVQLNSVDGELLPPGAADASQKDYKLDAVNLIKGGKIKEARQLICSQAGQDDMEEIIRWAYDNLDLWSDNDDGKDQAILIIRNALVNQNAVADQEINVSAMLVELAQIGE